MSVALFPSRQVKEAKLLATHARQLLHRRKDMLSEGTFADADAEIGRLEAAASAGDERAMKEVSEHLDTVFAKVQPTRGDAGWRENCEVLLVAFVLAIAIRAYFLQPFKIPTGSMEPTLNGIAAHPLPKEQPLPGFLRRGFDVLWFGRAYVDATSEVDDRLLSMTTEKGFPFSEYTRLHFASGHTYRVHAAPRTLQQAVGSDGFGVYPGREFRAGESIVHGYVDTGDQVFVDKFTYNFRLPHRADVFVFSTRDIAGIRHDEDPMVKSEFYIKRLAAVGGDTLRIAAPKLYRAGTLAPEAPFARVMSAENGYRGYSNPPPYQFHFLLTPDDTYTVEAKKYFALGDNSYNSLDSRAWGPVPPDNVVGRGLFVYWPFGYHWGFIN